MDVDDDKVIRLAQAVARVEQHRYVGFHDWYGMGELMVAARDVARGLDG